MNPAKVAVIYASLGVVWILFSDWLAGRWDLPGQFPLNAQTAKGLFYVLSTSAILYGLIRLIETRLEHERAWYRELFESNPQPMWVYDLDSLRFLEVNQAAILHYGYSRDEFLSMSIPDIRPVEEVPALLASVERAREGAEHFGIWRHCKKDGTEIRVEVFSHRTNFLGRRAKMVLAQDVTERLSSEERLRASEARLRTIVEHEPEAITITDTEGRVLQINPAGLALIQVDSESEVLGRYAESFVHSQDLAAYLASRAQVTATQRPATLEFRVVGRFGRLRWVEKSMVPMLAPDGRSISLLCVARDVTEARNAREALRESEARFRELAENTGDIHYNYDPVNDRLLYANDNFTRIWGRPLSEAYENPMSYLDGIHPEDRPAALEADRRQRRGESTETEYRVVRPDGSIAWVQDRSSSLVDHNGVVYRIVGTMRDITEKKRIEEALRESQTLSRIAARVSRLGGWTIDLAEPESSITWSDEVCLIHGVKPGHRPGMNEATEYFAPEHRATIYRAIERCVQEGHAFDEELEIIAANGRRVAVRTMGEAVRDANGNVFRVQGALQDVTEKKEAERRLQLSQLRYFQLADSMPFMVWTASADGRVDFANRAFTVYTGIPSDHELGERWLQAVHPDDLPRCFEVWSKSAESGTDYETEFRLRNAATGEHRWHKLTGTAIRDESGVVIKWYGTALDVHEIKLAEERAAGLARRLTKTVESITDAFLTIDREWRFTYVNREAERMLGRAREELLGRDMWVEFPAVKGSDFERQYRHALSAHQTVVFEAYYPPPLDKWFSVRAYPSSQGLAVYFRDVTQARADARRRQQDEERLRLITRATNDLIWDFDAVAGTIWWGEGFEKFFGAAPEERTTDESFWEARIHPEDRVRVVRGINQAFESAAEDWADEYRIRCSDGSYVHVLDRGFVVREGDGRAVRMIGGLTDLTERKRAEEDLRRLATELERERERLMEAQAVAKLGNWEADLLTGEITMSEENYRVYGLAPATFTPTQDGFFGLLHPEDRDRVAQAVAGARTRPGPHRLAHRIITPDGTVRHVEQNWRVVHAQDGTPLREIGTTQDITARAVLEEQFNQAQKMEAVGRLAGGVAHDFNNMLTVILIRSEQAARKLDADHPLRATFKEIYDAASRSAGLTRQLLTYARRQAVVPRLLHLNETIGAMQQMLRRLIGEDIALAWIPGDGLWQVRIDPAQVDQILANLCVNARDAISDVGRIVIETGNAVLDDDYCRTRPDHRAGEYATISVSDDGAGMDAETLQHLFEPFFTTKEVGRGTGLGLSTVYGIVQQNNGFIHVYSEPGLGATFRIYLPRAVAADAPAPVSPPVETPVGRGETVLVVEDEPMILEVTVEILRGLGYSVLYTTSPEQAILIAAEHPGRIDLLLTDVIMPGMNGRDLSSRIRGSRPETRILFMSGYTANIIATRGLVDRDAAFVQKPFSAADLAVKIRGLLDASAA